MTEPPPVVSLQALQESGVDALVAARPVPVYAQWEVAEVMAPCRDLVAIRPLVGDDGKDTYLSTEGVASQIVAHWARMVASGKLRVLDAGTLPPSAPSTVVDGSTTATSRSTCGRNSTRANASSERVWLSSAPAAPSV